MKLKMDGKEHKIWIEELMSGRLDKGKFDDKKLFSMIGYVTPDKRGKKMVWTTPSLAGGDVDFKTQEEAELYAQNETIIAFLLRDKGK